MISALLTMTALAGAPDAIGVSWNQPYLRTDPMTFSGGTDSVTAWGPTTTWDRQEPNEWHMYGGAVLEMQWNTDVHGEPGWSFQTGFRSFGADWTFGPLDFSAAVYDIFATAGAVQYLQEKKRQDVVVRGYLTGGGGLQFSVMAPTYWKTHITPAPRVYGGLGVLFGKGAIRVPMDVQVQLVPRLDYYEGHAEIDGGAVSWRYHPGSAAIAINIGVQWWGSGNSTDDVDADEQP